jgi:hypothetical protein
MLPQDLVSQGRRKSLQKSDDYLIRYAHRFRVEKSEDGILQIRTTHRSRDGMTFDIYSHSETHLAAMLPPQTGRNLIRRHPDTFIVQQDAVDAIVLLFPEDMLDNLAADLRLRRKRQTSEEERQRLAEMSRRFSPLRKNVESKKVISQSGKVA